MVDATIDRFGQLDIVIGNAGVGAYGPFLDMPDEQIEDMIDTNVKGLIYTLRAALPFLRKSEAADVVTVASEAGRRGLPIEAVYCSSKFAQVGLTRRSTTSCAARHPLHERLPRRRCDRLRDGHRANARHAPAGGHDEAAGCGRGDPVRAHAAAQPAHPGGRVPAGYGESWG